MSGVDRPRKRGTPGQGRGAAAGEEQGLEYRARAWAIHAQRRTSPSASQSNSSGPPPQQTSAWLGTRHRKGGRLLEGRGNKGAFSSSSSSSCPLGPASGFSEAEPKASAATARRRTALGMDPDEDLGPGSRVRDELGVRRSLPNFVHSLRLVQAWERWGQGCGYTCRTFQDAWEGLRHL
jgi:hypothetical protein